MRHYYDSAEELVGNTPLLKLNNVGASEGVDIFAKLELWNPAGSVKDRTCLYMVRAGIAFAAIGRGYNVVFVVPEKFSEEKQTLMRALGARIVNTPREDGMLGAAAKAEELLGQIPNSIALRQFAGSLRDYRSGDLARPGWQR